MKVLRETAKWPRLGAKVKRQVQAPQKVIKHGSFVIFKSYLNFIAKRSTRKAFVEGDVFH